MHEDEICRILIEATIKKAAEDYFDLLAGFLRPTRDCNIKELEYFFQSKYFATLTRLKPEYIMERIQEEAAKMVLEYTIVKEKGSSHYHVCRVGEEKTPLTGTYPTKKKALHKAAEMQGIDLKRYLQIRRRDGVNE